MALTQVLEYRPADVRRVYDALTYSEMVAGFPTLQPGDRVKVNSSGLTYEVVAQEAVRPLDHLKHAKLAYAVQMNSVESEALADTDAALLRVIDGVRIHGQGIAEADSGAVWTNGADGFVATLTTTDEAAHLVALSYGTDTEAFDAATYGPMSVEAVVSMTSALTDRALFVGFAAGLADALDPVVTGSGTTITLVNDDLVGLYFDSGLTAASRLYLPYNNANGAATIETTATGVDSGVNFSAAGTYVRLRVTVHADGRVVGYVNGAKVCETAAGAVATTVDLNPLVYVESNAAAVKIMTLKEFWFASEA
jgi:hypothetical protein